MQFDQFQLDLIRSRLLRYRSINRYDGRTRPWRVVLDDIMLCDSNELEFDRDTGSPPFGEEALRRFGNGSQTLDKDAYIEQILKFLIKKKQISPEEIDDAKVVSNLTSESPFFGLLGSTIKRTSPHIEYESEIWRSDRIDSYTKRNEIFIINFNRIDDNHLYADLHVEIYKQLNDDALDDRILLTSHKLATGLVVSSINNMMIFIMIDLIRKQIITLNQVGDHWLKNDRFILCRVVHSHSWWVYITMNHDEYGKYNLPTFEEIGLDILPFERVYTDGEK